MDGKILHSRVVLGQNSVPFTLWKFRTMTLDADKLRHVLIEKNGLNGCGKINNDSRITSFGKFMRKYFVDETPGLYNIARGDMNVVGIRPRPEEEWQKYFDEEHKDHALKYKPGLLSVAYYYFNLSSLNDLVETEKEYLKRRDRDPIKTDIHYRNRIISNVLFKGMRSS